MKWGRPLTPREDGSTIVAATRWVLCFAAGELKCTVCSAPWPFGCVILIFYPERTNFILSEGVLELREEPLPGVVDES